MDLQWRALTRADATAMAELNNAVHAADPVGELWAADEMDRSFDDAWRVAVPARFGAFADRKLIAFGMLFSRVAANPDHRMLLWGMVHPAFRRQGIGTEIVQRGLKAAPDLHERSFPDAEGLVVLELEDAPGSAELARACSFETGKRSLEMARALPRDPAEFDAWIAAPGSGLVVSRFAPRYVEELRQVHNDSFVPYHPGAAPVPAEAWERRFSHPTFRPGLSFLMLDSGTGEIGGYILSACVTERTGHTGPHQVCLATITTHRGYRRRGVATALIGAALSEAVVRGFETASLDVDSDNPAGAFQVYERAGFTITHSATTYARKIEE
ncbi:MAG TPA: GNAT family N-acetyltransferase [Actinocrinis sp.]|jgi:ribosomal protein S18 acetylase RimI-like enzyme